MDRHRDRPDGRAERPDLSHRVLRRMRPQRRETARRPGTGTLPALECQPRRPPHLGTAATRRTKPAPITTAPAWPPRAATPALGMPFTGLPNTYRGTPVQRPFYGTKVSHLRKGPPP